ncbi:hypothetical protein [Nitrosomonas sp. Nm58]|uniref:hypothetical protein n=1 Tax=Nitrosomonas sp. Nm58 TaxID=200126 RepID=UPI00089C20DC|nr:hypothetical protein [Nitrosomonas sp. Nm58]SDY01245.1 hypothetical protein SAMN05421754_100152 [Nitrosomonas sp. Nm58]
MTCAEIVTLLKDIVLSGAAITGAVVAVKGLGTWQRQLKGQSEYELSRRILVSVFKYRDAINGVRHPAMWAYEMPSPPEEEATKMSWEQIRFYGTSKAYQARWDKVQAERTTLYADLLEAEAIWGAELKELFKGVFDLEHELFTRIRHYVELINPDTDAASKEAIRNIDKNARDIMYDNLSEEPDEYKRDIISAVEKIEKYLKPKLSHEKV